MEAENYSQNQEKPSQSTLKLESQFQEMRQKYNENTFILTGPANNFFQGSLALQFANLTIQKSEQPEKKQHSSNVTKSAKPDKAHNIMTQAGKPINIFQSTITNRPSYAANKVIQVDDSEDPPTAYQIKNSPKNHKNLFQLPQFQNDGIHYTPTFAAEGTKLTNSQYYSQFMNKVKDYRRELSRDWIMQPRPRSKYMYCAICKDHYDEYLGHVNSRRHLQNYQKNKFTRYITSLELTINTGRFKKEKQIQEKRRATFQKKRQEKEENKNSKSKKSKKDSSSSQSSSQSQSDKSDSGKQSEDQDVRKVKKRQSTSSQEQDSIDKPRYRTREKKSQQPAKVRGGKRGRPRKYKEESSRICKRE